MAFHPAILGFLCFLLYGRDIVATEHGPQLTRATYEERSDQFLGSTYEYLQTSFEFDQDLFLNEPFLCVNAEESCPKLNCVPCDWSQHGAGSCWDERCCQPRIPVKDKEIWCSNSTLHSFTSIKVDELSPTHKLDKGETKYFRFFLGEEVYCRPVLFSVRSVYGNHQFFISSVFPEPNYELAYSETSVIFRQNQWSFAQSNTNICPGTQIYTPGTYAVAMTAYEPTAFYFEIRPSPLPHPLPPPEEKVSCVSVPEEEYRVAREAGRETLCLEDGITTRFDSRESRFGDLFDVILPIPPGCHGVSVAVQNYLSTFTDHDLVCLRLDDTKNLEYWDDYNAAVAAWRSTDDNINFFGCFAEPTFIHCAVQPWQLGEAGLIFSTVSPFLRTPLADIPPSILSSQMGIGSMVVDRPGTLACGDFHLWCSYWVSSGSPLVFWPPPAIASVTPGHYDPIPTTFLQSQHVDGMKIVFVDATLRADTRYGWQDSQLKDSVIIFLSITNADGLPVVIPPQTTPYSKKSSSLLEFLPHIRYSHQDVESQEKGCEAQEFHAYQVLIDDLITSVENSQSNLSSSALTYYVEVFNAENIYVDCVDKIINAFPQENRSLVRSGSDCFYEESDPEWPTDPCCNINLQSTQCCREHSVPKFSPVRVFVEQDEVECASDTECTESHFADFLRSYNDQFDGVIGCPSQSPLEKTRFINKAKESELKSMRHCLTLAGYGGVDGAQFTGSKCDDDLDCVHGCDKEDGICQVGTTEEMEIQFLRCWIQKMETFVEDYIRRKVFDSDETLAPRFSDQFFFALKKHATQPDCLSPSYPLDFTQRSHTTIQDTLYNSEFALICPGGDLCVYDHAPINSGVIVHDDYKLAEKRVPSCSELCFIAAECGGCREEGVCVSCVEKKKGTLEECTVQEGVEKDECEVRGACVHPAGNIEYGLTEAECKGAQGECSLCLYDTCTTWKSFDGVCHLSDLASQDECSLHGGVWDSGFSFCRAFRGQSMCQGSGMTWRSCGQFSVRECGSDSSLQSFLGCQWSSSISSPCLSQEDCESGGRCSDSGLLFPLEGGRRGGCAFAGVVIEPGYPPDILEAHVNYLGSPLGYMKTWVTSEEECEQEEGTNFWLDEALNEEECVGPEEGRWGCFLPGQRFTLAFMHEKEDCECLGGEYRAATSWESGKWIEPKFIPFFWNEEVQPPKYEWVDAVSFEKMSEWVVDSVQEKSTALTVSSLTCERNFTAATLDWIVCNCLSDSPNECYVSSAPRVATRRVCKGQIEELSAPSVKLSFQDDSISDGCAQIELGFVSMDGFTYLKKRPSITIQFEKPRNTGLVVNERGATVGEILGDGLEMSFLFEEFYPWGMKAVQNFKMCLKDQIQRESGEEMKETYFGEGNWADFALLQSDGTLKVLYMDVEPLWVSGYLYWCGTVEGVEKIIGGNSGTFFPVSRSEEASDVGVHSDQAKALAYVLSGFFLALLVLYFLLLVNNILSFHTMLGTAVPTLFLLLCVFRAVFFLMWAQGSFEENEVAEYILFETPTFLLFFLLLVLISCWKSISSQMKRSHLRELFLFGLVLFIYISIVVCSVVLNKTIDEEDSDCPGRAPSDNTELEDAFNTLSLVYMSLMTFIAFMLAGVLFFEARGIVRMVSKGFLMALIDVPTSRFTFVFLIFFLIRCILFIILYTLDLTSDIFVFVLLMVCEVIPCFILWAEVFLVTNEIKPSRDNHSANTSKTHSVGRESRRRLSNVPVSQQGTFSNVF